MKKSAKKVSYSVEVREMLASMFRAGFMGGLLYGASGEFDYNNPASCMKKAQKASEDMLNLIDMDGSGELMTPEQAKDAIAKAAKVVRKK